MENFIIGDFQIYEVEHFKNMGFYSKSGFYRDWKHLANVRIQIIIFELNVQEQVFTFTSFLINKG